MEPTTPPRSFVRIYLPWIAAAGMLLLYLVTLNKEVSLASVFPVARGAGMDWHPTYIAPFTWLVTLPVRYLPPGIQLFTLNFVGALAAALTLALLARSVALLPHDRTHDQRIRQSDEHALLNIRMAWLPPVFAVLLLGLQRTFWENSIICTGETIDVLLIAYVVRCLLEFRVSGRDSWLWKMALVYGIGFANNYTFIAFAPAMLVAVVWLKKLRLFEFTFLTRLILFGALGLCLYLVLPIVQTLSSTADSSFWQTLKVNLGYQKQVILSFPRWRAWWLGGYPLVLMLMIAVRWPSGWGDSSRVGSIIGTAMAHLMHAVLLALTIWMALDLPTSPRHMGMGLAFLGSYYLGALAAGYLVGYLLVVFAPVTSAPGRRPSQPGIMKPIGYFVTAIVVITVIAVPVKLVMDNWERVAALNAPYFRDYAGKLAESLPDKPSVVLSDDSASLYAVGLAGARQKGHMLVETHSLTNANYLKFLQARYGNALPQQLGPEAKNTPVPGYVAINLFTELKKSRELFYLHPSFGLFFEVFYQEPHQLVYKLEQYPQTAVEPPPPSAATIQQQTEMWNNLTGTTLQPLEKKIESIPATDEARGRDSDALVTAQKYSRALDWWAVELQRAGRMEEAVKYLNEALALSSNNASAFITREANIALRRTGKRLERLSDEAEAVLRRSPGVEALLNSYGPVDEAAFRFEIMQTFAQSGLWRQAAQNVLRAMAFAPEDVSYKVALANIYLGWGQPDRALEIVQGLRTNQPAAMPPAVVVDIARTEAAAKFAKNDFAGAESLLKRTEEQNPEQDGSYLALSQLYLTQADAMRRGGNTDAAGQMMTNALRVAERQIKQQPDSPGAYFNHGNILMFLTNYAGAVSSFSKVIEIDPKNAAALLNRAIAHLQSKNLEKAQQDYEKLLGFTQTSFRVYYGLAEIAYQKKDWDAAEDYYEKYLKYAPPASEESKFVQRRLEEVEDK